MLFFWPHWFSKDTPVIAMWLQPSHSGLPQGLPFSPFFKPAAGHSKSAPCLIKHAFLRCLKLSLLSSKPVLRHLYAGFFEAQPNQQWLWKHLNAKSGNGRTGIWLCSHITLDACDSLGFSTNLCMETKPRIMDCRHYPFPGVTTLKDFRRPQCGVLNSSMRSAPVGFAATHSLVVMSASVIIWNLS